MARILSSGKDEWKSQVTARIQELVDAKNFPQLADPERNYLDVATDVVGGTLEIACTPMAEMSKIGIELNFKSMAGTGTLNIYTSNSGNKAGAVVATTPIAGGDSNNIIELTDFCFKYVVLEFTGLTTGQIHNITVLGKRG